MNKNFSCPLFKENLKRFWGFSAVVFMAYFLTTNFVVLVQSQHLYADTVRGLVSLKSPGYIAFDVIAPVVSAVIMFSYLSKVNSTTAMHTMPFSRKSLFITNYISGLALVWIPLIINSLVSIVLNFTVIDNASKIFGADGNIHNLISVKLILLALGWNAICVLFTYSISVLAGMFSGNSIIHLLTAGAMNFILPVLYLVCQGYAELFLYGYTESDSMWNFVSRLHPVFLGLGNTVSYLTGLRVNVVSIRLLTWIVYTAVAVVIAVLAFIFYKKRKLEKAGDSYVFNFVKYIIAFIFTFVPATGLGMMLAYDSNLWLGLAIGGVVGFIIGWMIINKSFKIFNLKDIITFLACALLSLAIILGFKFDIFGYENRIPKASDVEFVTYKSSYVGNTYWNEEVKNEENINNLMGAHKNIIDAHEDTDSWDSSIDGQSFHISYYLKNGSTIARSYYDVPTELFLNNNELKLVYESEETNKYANELLLFDPKEVDLNIICPFLNFAEYAFDIIDGNEKIKEELINALVKDLSERTYEEAISHRLPYMTISLNQNIGEEEYIANREKTHYIDMYSIGNEGYLMSSAIQMNSDYERVIAVLSEYGLLDKIIPGEEYGFMYITPNNTAENDEYRDQTVSTRMDTYEGMEAPASKQGLVVVSDSTLQRAILENAAFQYTYNIKPEDRYRVSYMAYDMCLDDQGYRKLGYAYETNGFNIDYSKLPKEVQIEINKYL